MSSGLSPEAARALFQRALDDDLSPDEKSALEHALASDAELARELSGLRQLSARGAALASATPSVDILSSVQQKLRARSGGRFYRDRFAEKQGQRGALIWIIATSLVVVLGVVLWLSLRVGLFSP